MPALSKNVALRAFGGTMVVSVDVHSATQKAPSNALVCVGSETTHDAVRVTTQMVCATCGVIHPSQTRKARPVGNEFVVLTDDDVAEVQGDVSALKKQMDLLPHPTTQIDQLTAPGATVNHLAPAAGYEASYATLADIIAAHPEVTFMTRWVPRTKMSVYSLHVLTEPTGRKVLVLRERVAGDQLKPAPDFTPTDVMAPFVAVAEQYLALSTVDFDLEQYRDTTQDRLAALVAGRTAVSLDGVPPTMPKATSASLEGLQALVAQLQADQQAQQAPAKPKRVRKPRKAAAAPVLVEG